jgi:CheY-like chemotaxis protein
MRDGMGMVIIKRNIPHALGGDADVHFGASGLVASFVIPARHLQSPARAQTETTETPAHLPATQRPLEGYTILVVEDQMATALTLERALSDRGASSVTSVGTAAKALEAIAAEIPDVAILDIDLGEGTSVDVADELARQSVPFIFAATEIDMPLIPPRHRDVPTAPKPYSADIVTEMLKEALLPHLIRAVLGRLI